MTVFSTTNVSGRVRGILASVALELAPGVYVAPKLNKRTLTSILDTLRNWFQYESNDASIAVVWRDTSAIGGISHIVFGASPIEICDLDGLLVSHRVAAVRGMQDTGQTVATMGSLTNEDRIPSAPQNAIFSTKSP
jgi:CRISPR-associated protein Cas2